jgi:hypothetical protein
VSALPLSGGPKTPVWVSLGLFPGRYARGNDRHPLTFQLIQDRPAGHIRHIAEAPHRGPRARAGQEAALHLRPAHPRQHGSLLRPAVRRKSLIIRTVLASVEQTEDALANDVDDGWRRGALASIARTNRLRYTRAILLRAVGGRPSLTWPTPPTRASWVQGSGVRS